MKGRGGGWGLLALGKSMLVSALVRWTTPTSVNVHLGRHGAVTGEAWTHRVEQTDVEKPPLTQDVVGGCELPG